MNGGLNSWYNTNSASIHGIMCFNLWYMKGQSIQGDRYKYLGLYTCHYGNSHKQLKERNYGEQVQLF